MKPFSNVYCVILAGGNGERLWPLSRRETPKQLLALNGEKNLLNQTIDRVKTLVPEKNIWISTTSQHAQTIHNTVGNSIGNIIVEPSARNSGPAILLSCLQLYKKDSDAAVIFLSADAFIPETDTQKFLSSLKTALITAQERSALVLFGKKPTQADTRYGYIEYDVQAENAARVVSFKEKPDSATAQTFFAAKNMLWNMGIFVGGVQEFIEQYKEHAPIMVTQVQKFLAGNLKYDLVTAQSVDYAVMEKSKNLYILPIDFDWCDVGNISIFVSLKKKFGTARLLADEKNKVISVGSHNNVVDVHDKVVALVGVDDLCIVQTDDALLITKKDQAEQVKAVVQQLKKRNENQYL